jgi:phage repressor protein C with HTH and peptisase S24 domain
MFTHESLWHAIDHLAQSIGTSTSGLAKRAGLDATSFNKSKRFGADGKPRWPSTESIARVLAATELTMLEFLAFMPEETTAQAHAIPLITTKDSMKKNSFDEHGFPNVKSADIINFPNFDPQSIFALEINDKKFESVYPLDSILIIEPHVKLRRGDKVFIKGRKDIFIGVLSREIGRKIDILSYSTQSSLQIPYDDIEFMARILWVSQ